MTLPHTNGSAKGMQQAWLRSSVEKFFSTINWDDRPLEVKARAASADPTSEQTNASNGSTPLSLTMSVSQFFELFPWEGQRVIAAPLPVEAPIVDEVSADEITLDDFSELF